MRKTVIHFLKKHPIILDYFWALMRFCLSVWGMFIPIDKKSIIFCSFGGRKFDDSPRAIYDEICSRKEFEDWHIYWAFNNPDDFNIPRGEKIKVDTLLFFKVLLKCYIWVSNSGMDRGIELHRKKNIIVETWHGTPLKKILGDENCNSLGSGIKEKKKKKDKDTIRCAQSNYDKKLFGRLFNADDNSIMLCDLPRNDELMRYNEERISTIKKKIGITEEQKVILYTPTYREYLVDESKEFFLIPPIDFDKWKRKMGDEYILLVRAHYAVSKLLGITNDGFVVDVSNYSSLNDLYIISDIMISDYSSSFIDYSILDRPMVCFAYDLDEYSAKRGLYVDLESILPCPICRNENDVIDDILNMDYVERVKLTKNFHNKYAPYAGNASQVVVDKIISRL